ncbi:MAG TPA: ABC transporter permease [Deltaproteobacteria bacterium]|nr:ABC transporter permease [Deltaproteobacteria bacterium]
MSLLPGLARFGRFLGQIVWSTVSNPLPVGRALEEAHRIGVNSLPILLVVSVFVGTNLSVQGASAFSTIHAERYVGMFVALAGVREMAPIMVASMVAAKAGTEMASQIAVMRIQEQIDALEVMAIDPYWFLITPRLLGILLVLPALTMISIFTLVVSAYGVAITQLGLDGHTFLEQATATTHAMDLVYCAVKAFVFGLVICVLSCYHGFTSGAGASGVGRATNAAVVMAAVSCAILNYLLSELLFG